MDDLKARAIAKAKQILADDFACTEFDDVDNYVFDFVAFNGFVVRFVEVRIVDEFSEVAEYEYTSKMVRFENGVVDYTKKHPEKEYKVIDIHQFDFLPQEDSKAEIRMFSECLANFICGVVA